jgi:hypothetical protein
VLEVKHENKHGQVQTDVRYFFQSMSETSTDFHLLPIFDHQGIKTDSLKAQLSLQQLQENSLSKKVVSLPELFEELPSLRAGNKEQIRGFLQRNKYLINEQSVFKILLKLSRGQNGKIYADEMLMD